MRDIHRPKLPDSDSHFRAIYVDAYPDVLRFISRRVSPSQAEDVAAEVFLVVWRRLLEVPSDHSSARAWVFGVARQTILTTHRGNKRREALGVRLANPALFSSLDDPSDPGVLDRRVDLTRAWPMLADVDQETLALAYWDDLTSSQAAQVLNISPVAFRLRLTRARRHLRRHLEIVERVAPSLPPVSEWSRS